MEDLIQCYFINMEGLNGKEVFNIEYFDSQFSADIIKKWFDKIGVTCYFEKQNIKLNYDVIEEINNIFGDKISVDKKDDVLKDIEVLKRICSLKSDLLKLKNKWGSSKSGLSHHRSIFGTTIPKNKWVPSKRSSEKG